MAGPGHWAAQLAAQLRCSCQSAVCACLIFLYWNTPSTFLSPSLAAVQEYYRRAAEQQLAELRRQHAHDPATLAAVLARETPALEAAQEAATRNELSHFVQEVRPLPGASHLGPGVGWRGPRDHLPYNDRADCLEGSLRAVSRSSWHGQQLQEEEPRQRASHFVPGYLEVKGARARSGGR